jgi:hypothetical protein
MRYTDVNLSTPNASRSVTGRWFLAVAARISGSASACFFSFEQTDRTARCKCVAEHLLGLHPIARAGVDLASSSLNWTPLSLEKLA